MTRNPFARNGVSGHLVPLADVKDRFIPIFIRHGAEIVTVFRQWPLPFSTVQQPSRNSRRPPAV
jgi:hypothetical protein